MNKQADNPRLAIFMANGCEEIEGLTVVDLVRRAGIPIDMVSVHMESKVTGSHGIAFETDVTAASTDWSSYTGVVLPGGMPGTNRLKEDGTVDRIVREYAGSGKLVAAICASPTVLAECGVLNGKNATCYPGLELPGANAKTDPVVRDGNILTSRGVGTAIPFALAIVEYFQGKESAKELAEKIVFS